MEALRKLDSDSAEGPIRKAPRIGNAGELGDASVLLEYKDAQLVGYLSQRCTAVIGLAEAAAREIKEFLMKNPTVVVWGKECAMRRNVGFFSDTATGYKYSGQTMPAKGLTPGLTDLLDSVNTLFGATYNGVLVNEYETGHDYIGAHSDNEKELDPSAGVVSVSVGAPRKFVLRKKTPNEDTVVARENCASFRTKGRNKQWGPVCRWEVSTGEYPILQMKGSFQKHFTHEVPAQTTCKKRRISFTFRQHSVK